MAKRATLTTTMLLAGGLAAGALAQSPVELKSQMEAYEAVQAKNIIDLQPFRKEHNAMDPVSGLHLRLIDLNPGTRAWYLLQIRTEADGKPDSYHIENPDPARQDVTFQTGEYPAIVIRHGQTAQRCRPWQENKAALTEARGTRLPYAAICGGKLFLRNKVAGNRTNLEAATDFLRDNVWGGESIVRFVKNNFYEDSEMETSKVTGSGTRMNGSGPTPMRANTTLEERQVISTLLDVGLREGDTRKMAIGIWYPVASAPGIYASAFQPRRIAKEVFEMPGTANRIGSVEGKATGYMIAFDMDQFDIGFAVGTDHPAVAWSSRPPYSVRPRGLPGPDGIKNTAPVVRLGMVNPVIASRTAATFTAGFKRQHGAWKYGDMATFNLGHHYGFIEKGVVLSKLQPNLSTLYRLHDGTLQMKTWREEDNKLLPRIEFARQNGVPLVETDPETGIGVVGDRVTSWGGGNWSGSAEAQLRTLRAGACMARNNGKNYLIYGYFSTATPSAMARTFQAYGCHYAMLLDMNALEHTYLALYVRKAGKVYVEHLVPGMALIEKKVRGGTIVPRFIGFADNRDFFYLTRKEGTK